METTNRKLEQEIEAAYVAEMMEIINDPQRPTAAQRKRELENSIGTFEECIIAALYK